MVLELVPLESIKWCEVKIAEDGEILCKDQM